MHFDELMRNGNFFMSSFLFLTVPSSSFKVKSESESEYATKISAVYNTIDILHGEYHRRYLGIWYFPFLVLFFIFR